MKEKFKLSKLEKSWILYDVANSAFTLLVSTLLPIYFNALATSAGLDEDLYLSYWGYAGSIATILVAFIVVAIDLLIREPIGLGTILDALLVGIFHDMFDAIGLVPTIHNPLIGVPVMLVGMVVMSYSQYLYMSACLGCGPRDALLVGLGKKLRRLPIGLVSILLTAVVTCVGFLLGGSVGIGTVLFLLCSGAVMQLVFSLIRFEPRNLTHMGLHQMLDFRK